jgi:hypothetical protein
MTSLPGEPVEHEVPEPGRCRLCGVAGDDHVSDAECQAAQLAFETEQVAQEETELRRELLAALRDGRFSRPASLSAASSFWLTVAAILVALLAFPPIKALLGLVFDTIGSVVAFVIHAGQGGK